MTRTLYAIAYSAALALVVYIGLTSGPLLGGLAFVVLVVCVGLVFAWEMITEEWK